jgi:hypothetical protein
MTREGCRSGNFEWSCYPVDAELCSHKGERAWSAADNINDSAAREGDKVGFRNNTYMLLISLRSGRLFPDMPIGAGNYAIV